MQRAISRTLAIGHRSHSRKIAVLAATTLWLTMALPLALPGNAAAGQPSAAGGSGVGVVSADGGSVVGAGGSGVGVVSAAGESTVAQSDEGTDLGEGTERRLVERQSSERVDGVVIALFSIAGVMSVMLAVFLWHTSPRRRLRLARARSQARDPGNGDEGVV